MTTEKKHCSRCGKKLKASNERGYCGNRGAAACAKRAADAGGVADDAVLERVNLVKPPPSVRAAKSDAVKRFRIVAEAMGFEPDKLLEEYCEGWLAAVKQAALKLEAADE